LAQHDKLNSAQHDKLNYDSYGIPIMMWQIKAAVAAVLITGAFIAGWQVRTWKADADALQANIAAEDQRLALQAKVDTLTKAGLANERKIHENTNTIIKRIVATPATSSCESEWLRYIQESRNITKQANDGGVSRPD